MTEQVIMKMPQIFGWGGPSWGRDDSILSFQDGAIRINGTNWPAGSITQPTQAGTQDKATVEFLDLNGWLKITDHQSGQELGGVYGVTGPQSVTFTPISDAVDLWFGYAGDSGSVRVQNLTTTLLSSTSPPPPPPPPPTITLTASGPVKSTRAGQVFEYLDITATNGTGIEILHNNVTVRFCRIRYGSANANTNAFGIYVHGCASPNIHDVEIEQTGPFLNSDPRQSISINRDNIALENVSGSPVIDTVKGTKGARGIYVLTSPCPGMIHNVQFDDVRGTTSDDGPGGNSIQFNQSPGWTLDDFSFKNGPTSFTEDNINCGNSPNTTIKTGRIHYNNSPSGVGVLLEFGSDNCLVQDVDCTHMGNGAFSGVQNNGSTFNRGRTRDSVNGDLDGRGAPTSNSLSFGALGGSVSFKAGKYYNLANPGNIIWDKAHAPNYDITSENFTPRPFKNLTFPWS
jgi:hypothetical protein